MENLELKEGVWYTTNNFQKTCLMYDSKPGYSCLGYWKGGGIDTWEFFNTDFNDIRLATFEDMLKMDDDKWKNSWVGEGLSYLTSWETTQAEPENKFNKIAFSLADLLTYKNEKYGNSALNPLNIFAGKTKVGQRMDDKIARIQNSPELRKNDVADLMGYLTLVCVENDWTDFSEFKD